MLLMPAPTGDISERVLRDAFALSVFGPFLLTGAIAPAMAERGSAGATPWSTGTGAKGSIAHSPRSCRRSAAARPAHRR